MIESRFYKLVAIGFFISNLILLGFLWVGKPKHPEANQGPKQKVIERLNFNESQVAAYEDLIDVHGENMGAINEEIMQARSAIFATLNSTSNEGFDSLNLVLSELKSDVERKHFQHFQDIKKLCDEQQLIQYDEIVEDFSKMFFSKPIRKRKH